ncbi:cyclic nucleotide-binding domain-containing protein 2-like isoform X1 [Biomphalaria glabrata]|uniref:Uncharacterized protein LOC106062845 isoform X2 n=1 Tax=Biomphalaria glabrata TaxID=6526 RepID=A0A9U8E8I3_BIOGL|nr:uncharacterized protein LOC106062845 isoform X2 [Biomphalaria glabrata]
METFVPFREPPETDLEYYSRPENYTGSNLTSLSRFIAAKRQESAKISSHKSDPGRQTVLAERYNERTHSYTCDSSLLHPPNTQGDEREPEVFLADPQNEHQTSNTKPNYENLETKGRKSESRTGKGCKLTHSDASEDGGLWSTDKVSKKIERRFPLPTDGNEKRFTNERAVDVGDDTLLEKVKTFKVRAKSASYLLEKYKMIHRASKCWSATSRISSRNKEIWRQQIVEKFRNTILAVKVVVKLAKTIMKTSDSPSALLKTFTALSTAPKENEEEKSSENMKKYGLHFDPSYFKANREISLSSEVRSILKLHPDRRTQEQIQTTVFGLQSIPSFAEYPLHMQEKLAKVAWLDIVTPNRTIIRQGHFAENFYFIVSGQALVTIHRPGDASAQTAALMRKGTSFGELALLHHSRRTATVTSHDTVQLLSVGRDDFFDIFMSRHIKGEIPEHIKFLSQLDFMKDWPIERLLERPDQCLLHFFKRNMVIVKDSHRSDWLYVVKSGSCQVLKQLKGVTAKLGPSRSPRQSQTDRLSRPRGSLFEGNDNDEKRSSKQDNRLQTTESDYNNDLEKVASSAVLDSAVSKSKTRDDPVFVRIELLKPMDVFGLDLVNFNSGVEVESTSVSLVSLGSECIMLSKHFFMKHANDKVKKRLSETVTPYPNEATLQDSLQHKVNWELYKQSILNAAFTKCKLLKRKFLAVH